MYYSGGTPLVHPYTSYIRYTEDPFLYIYSRLSETKLTYSLPVGEGEGPYVLILHFLETDEKLRVFDIVLGDQVVRKDVEIAEEVGPSAALELYLPFHQSKDGLFSYNGTVLPPAAKSKSIDLSFVPKENTSVQISAIQLGKGTLDPQRLSKQIEHISLFQRVKFGKSKQPPTLLAAQEKEELAEQITGLTVLYRYPVTIVLGGVLVFLVINKAKSS